MICDGKEREQIGKLIEKMIKKINLLLVDFYSALVFQFPRFFKPPL